MLLIAACSGFLLAVLIGGSLAGIYISGWGDYSPVESGFYTLLRDYDFKHRRVLQEGMSQYQEFNNLNRELDRLELKAEGVESWLSILKRRRQIAALDHRHIQAYRQSTKRAALAFPYSEPIAIIAAAALIHEAAITGEGEEELREILPLLSSSRNAPARLSFHVLLDDFKDPRRAAANLPREFLEPELLPLPAVSAAKIVPNLVIMKILAGDIYGAGSTINATFARGGLSYQPSNEFIRLAAEYFYDFGDVLRSAELFSMLPDEDALSRQADALWLAAYDQNARNIWAILAATQTRALYNYAISSQSQTEAGEQYEILIKRTGAHDLYHQYGVIRYSRLMEVPRALVFLNAERAQNHDTKPTDTEPPTEPLIEQPAAQPPQATLSIDALFDLEILKRRTKIAEIARLFAEIWLLLDRYPGEEDLYQWGAWFFALQRNTTESALLLRAANRHNFTGHWKDIYDALLLINEGNLDAAEEELSPIPLNNETWVAAANLGRIYEARQSPARALASYEKAFAIISNNTLIAGWKEAGSRLQVRIAYCHRLMGKDSESRRAMEYALSLNPDNINARLGLDR